MRIRFAISLILWTVLITVAVALSGEVKSAGVNKCVYPGRVVYTDRECQAGSVLSKQIKAPKPLEIAKNWPYWKPAHNYAEIYPTYRYIDDGYVGSSYSRYSYSRYSYSRYSYSRYRDSCNYCYSTGYNHLIYRRFNKPIKPARLIPTKPTYHRLKPR